MTEALAAIIGALLGGLVTYVLQGTYERRRHLHQIRLEVQLLLMQLTEVYSWFVGAEERNLPVNDAIRDRARGISWQIVERLQTCDRIEFVDDILAVLFSARFARARDRYDAIQELSIKLGQLSYPKFFEAMSGLDSSLAPITDLTELARRQLGQVNAPGAFSVSFGDDIGYPPSSSVNSEGKVDLKVVLRERFKDLST